MSLRTSGSVPRIAYTIDVNDLKAGALAIVSSIRPSWSSIELSCKLFTDGITNRLVGVYHSSEANPILVRVYGENTGTFIDRDKELRNMMIMHKAGLSPPVYCAFNNGIAYGYSPGIVADRKSVRDALISGMIAETMARMHSLSPDRLPVNDKENQPEAEDCLFTDLNKFLGLIDSSLPVCEKLKSVDNLDALSSEVSFLEHQLKRLSSPIVFCHNDLLVRNIVHSEVGVSFIDLEYSDYNYQAYDIANHFVEFCETEFDASLYPSREFQLRWIERYLRKWYSLTGRSVTEAVLAGDVEALSDVVNKFTLAPLLYWGLWALVQATNSSIEFDYCKFAHARIEEYFRRKETLH